MQKFKGSQSIAHMFKIRVEYDPIIDSKAFMEINLKTHWNILSGPSGKCLHLSELHIGCIQKRTGKTNRS